MTRQIRILPGLFILALGAPLPALRAVAEEPPLPQKTLIAFDAGQVPWSGIQDARLDVRQVGPTRVLGIATGHQADWPGVTFKAPNGFWDLSRYAEIAVDVRNLAAAPVTVYCRVDGQGGDGIKNSLTDHVALQPGQQRVLRVPLVRKLPSRLASKLYGMRGDPGGARQQGLDASRITQLILFVNKPDQDHAFQVSPLRAQGNYRYGENYQIGLIDICDRPYPETIDAVREVGNALYTVRMRHASPSSP